MFSLMILDPSGDLKVEGGFVFTRSLRGIRGETPNNLAKSHNCCYGRMMPQLG